MAPHPHPQEDKSDRHSAGAGASREQERRPSKAWGILIFGLIGVTTASFAVRAPLLPLLRLCSLEFLEDAIPHDASLMSGSSSLLR